MAAGDLVYGTRTPLANVSRLNSLTNGQAKAFGEIDNTALKALDYNINLEIVLGSAGTTAGGQVELYMVESQDGVNWTDGIDPTTATGDVAAQIKDAILIDVFDAQYVTTTRTTIKFHFNICEFVDYPAEYFGFVVRNLQLPNTTALAASGHLGNSASRKLATS
jgi:hypothetical protein